MTVSNINKVRLASPIEFDSVVNGEGLRIVIWFQGCLFACPGCHNEETWTIDGGTVYDIDEVIEEIRSHNHEHIDGITLSGGDPMFQVDVLKVILPQIKEMDLNVWMYSGEIYENLIKDKDFMEIRQYIDVLVDGRFVLRNLDLKLKYRGSSNQRLIDIPKTVASDKVVLWSE